MDRREAAAAAGSWYDWLDEKRMVAIVLIEVETEDGETEETEVEVPVKFEVCSTCEGKGRHVNPSIDAHGICEDEWGSWSHEERETYLNGGYDVICYECSGKRVVPVPDQLRLTEEHRAALEKIKETKADRLADWHVARMESGLL